MQADEPPAQGKVVQAANLCRNGGQGQAKRMDNEVDGTGNSGSRAFGGNQEVRREQQDCFCQLIVPDKIVTASEEIEDGEDANGDKNYVTVETPGALTADNWFNYVYAGGANLFTDNTYNGCSLLETKPTVTLVTTPQPTPAQ